MYGRNWLALASHVRRNSAKIGRTMKIDFDSAETFLEEVIREAKAGHLWCKQIRYSPVSKPEQQEAISFRVSLILTAVIDLGTDGQYLAESVVNCGCDDPDADPKDSGSQEMMAVMRQVHKVGQEEALQVLPGRMRE